MTQPKALARRNLVDLVRIMVATTPVQLLSQLSYEVGRVLLERQQTGPLQPSHCDAGCKGCDRCELSFARMRDGSCQGQDFGRKTGLDGRTFDLDSMRLRQAPQPQAKVGEVFVHVGLPFHRYFTSPQTGEPRRLGPSHIGAV